MKAIISQRVDLNNPPEDAVTLGRRLAVAIVAAGGSRPIVDAGFTVGDFIKALRELGIQDTDQLASIEYGISANGTGELCKELDETGAVTVREISRSERR